LSTSKGRFLHIGFMWSSVLPKTKELEPVFGKALDWLRYAPNCWIVWTTSLPEVWYQRLKPHLGTSDQVFICQIDATQRSGWLSKWIWEWLNKAR
jgi:hypothetical protein